jgi:hypothetical protein
MGDRAVYSPLGLQKMEQYRARMRALVKEGKLTQREAEILSAVEMRRITDRIRSV